MKGAYRKEEKITASAHKRLDPHSPKQFKSLSIKQTEI